VWQFTYVLLLRLLQAAIRGSGAGAAGPLSAAWLGLYQPPTVPITPQSTMANITEANYDGYSRQLVVWFPPYISAAGPEQMSAQDLFFMPIDPLVANQITGVFLADAFYGGSLLAAAVLPAPGVQLTGPTRALKVQPNVQLSTAQLYGAPIEVF
jgi:hypothetical protein